MSSPRGSPGSLHPSSPPVPLPIYAHVQRREANTAIDRHSAAPVTIDQTVSDFDGVLFHISTPETKSKIVLSIQIRCFKDLVRYGAEQVLQREYGDYVIAPEPGFDFSVMIDLENLPSDKGMDPFFPVG